MTRRSRPLAVLGALLLLAGCGGGTGGVADILIVAQVDVAPAPGSLAVGQTVPLTATPRTSSGIVVPNRTITWSSSSPATATVSGTGLVTAVAAAAVPVVISARVDGVTGSVSILIAEVPVDRVTVTPSTVSVFLGETTPLQAQAFDAGNNPLSRPILWASSAPAVASVGTTGLVTGVTAGSATITASTGGQSGSAAVTVRSRPATRLGFLVQPGSSTAGTAITPPVQVAVLDDVGATVPGATHSITVALGANPSGGTLSGQQTVSAVNGVALFSGLRIDKAGPNYFLSASASGLTTAQSLLFSVLAGAPGGLRLDAAPSPNATNGVPFPAQPVVQLVDAGNNPVASVVPVTVTATGPGAILGGTTTLSTNAAGQAAFTDLRLTGVVGPYQLTFSAPGVTGAASGTVTLGPGAATQLLLTTPPTASPQSGVPFPTQPAVRLADLTGNFVSQAGVSVAAARTSGTATLSGTLSATTTATGTATWTDLRLTGTAGPHVLTFSTAGLTSVSTGTLALTAGPATSLVITTQPPATATSAAAFTSSTVVALRDANNNPLLQAGVPITATIATGAGGTLSGATTVTTIANGTATFSNLTLTGSSGSYTLQFAGPGLTSVISTTVTLSAGTGSKLGITTQPPGTATNGVAFSQAPVIQLLDASNNPVSQGGVSVTVSILTGSGTLSGTFVRSTNSGGAATFPGLAITGSVAQAHTLLFAAPGFVAVQSNAITLVAGAAASVSANTPLNPSATAGTAVTPAPSVKVRDVGGIPLAAVSVTFTASAGSTLSPASPATVATNASGDAGVTSWTLSTTAGPNTLTASVAGVGSVVFTGTGTAGAATTIAANSSPPASAPAGTAVTAPSVLVTDGTNPVSGVSVSFAITAGTGSTTPASPVVVVTNGSGVAALTTWTLGATAGANTVTATAAGLAGSPVTFTVTGTAGAATTITANSSPPASAPAGTAVTAPSVLVTDGTNPVSGVSVSFAITAGTGSTTPASPVVVVTNGSGVAALTTWTLGATAGANTVTATAAGLAGSPVTFTVTGTAGVPTSMAANSTVNQSAAVNTAVAGPPSVVVRDAGNNPVAGASVTFNVTTGGGSIVPAGGMVTTDASGIATLTSWTLGAAAGTDNNSVTASLAGLPDVVFTASATAGTPTSMAANSTVNQSAAVNTAVAAPPSVVVRDAGNNPVAGASVTFTVTTGGGSIVPAGGMVTTDASGIATLTSWTLGAAGGTDNNSVTASLAGLADVVFTASATAGSATSLTSNSNVNQSATVGTAVGAPPSVLVRDTGNNPVAGVDVAFSVTSGGGSISPVSGTVTTDASGIATLTSWTVGTTAGTNNNTVSASLGALGPVVFTASATAGPATAIALNSGPPASAPSGSSVTPPAVLVTDANNNPVAGVDVTFAITVGAGSITPANGLVTTNASGIAALTSWTLDATAGANAVDAIAAGLTGSPVPFTVTGTASQLFLTQQPSASITDGVVFPQQPIVQLRDAAGNPVSQMGVAIGVAITAGPGGGVLNGNTSPSTAADGSVTFTDLSVSGPAGTYTLTFSSAGLTSVTADVVIP